MKKITIILLLTLFSTNSFSNPIWVPEYIITELFFDDSGDWTLELCLLGEPGSSYDVDSVCLFSSSDTIKIPNEILLDSTGYLLLTAELLNETFNINPEGDSLTITNYWEGIPFGGNGTLLFGDVEGAFIGSPSGSQSLALYANAWCFVKDNTPNLGFENDTSGMCGTLSGYVYDISLFPAKNRTFLLDFPFDTDENGHYSLRVLSRPKMYNWIRYYTWQGDLKNCRIDTLEYVMEPDSVMYSDIFLTDTILSEINVPTANKLPVKIYPNPINKNQKLIVDIDLPVVSANFKLLVKSIDGKYNAEYQINTKSMVVEIPHNKGIYLVTVMLDNQVVTTRKIVKINE